MVKETPMFKIICATLLCSITLFAGTSKADTAREQEIYRIASAYIDNNFPEHKKYKEKSISEIGELVKVVLYNKTIMTDKFTLISTGLTIILDKNTLRIIGSHDQRPGYFNIDIKADSKLRENISNYIGERMEHFSIDSYNYYGQIIGEVTRIEISSPDNRNIEPCHCAVYIDNKSMNILGSEFQYDDAWTDNLFKNYKVDSEWQKSPNE